MEVEMEVKRSANFSADEIELLINLIKNKKHIVECKKTDKLFWKEKENCWKEIEVEYNNINGKVHRSAAVLKKKYENLKKRTKVKFANNKCNYKATGGGTAISDTSTTVIDDEIHQLLGVRIDGFDPINDSDFAVDIMSPDITVNIDNMDMPSTSHQTGIEKGTVPVHDGKRKYTGTNTNKKWSNLAETKEAYAKLQIKCLSEEQNFKKKRT